MESQKWVSFKTISDCCDCNCCQSPDAAAAAAAATKIDGFVVFAFADMICRIVNEVNFYCEYLTERILYIIC